MLLMSHITRIKTKLTNKFILEETLEKLNLKWKKVEVNEQQALQSKLKDQWKGRFNKMNEDLKSPRIDFIVAQNNGSNIAFIWTGAEYEIAMDFTHWNQSSSVNAFLLSVEQQYSVNLLMSTAENLGFEPEVKSMVTNKGDQSCIIKCKGWA